MIFNKPVVSVIIPCYNYGAYLPEAIESALENQTEGMGLDIIVVDDGSTDNTAESAKKFGERVRYFYQENKGPSEARNHGLREARGDYVMFLDADDLLGKNAIAGHLNNFRNNPGLGVSTGMCLCTKTASSAPFFWPVKGANLDLHICDSNIAPIHSFMLKSSVARNAGFFDPSIKACEDYDYWLRCMDKGYTFHPAREGMAVYRFHANSLTSQRKQMVEGDMLVRMKIEKMLESNPDFPRAGKYYGWLAYAAGCMGGMWGLLEASPDFAVLSLKKAAQSVLKALSLKPENPSEDPSTLNAEQYYAIKFLLSISRANLDENPILKRAVAAMAKAFPHLMGKTESYLASLANRLYARTLLDKAREIPEEFR